jgi:hypothetical protein
MSDYFKNVVTFIFLTLGLGYAMMFNVLLYDIQVAEDSCKEYYKVSKCEMTFIPVENEVTNNEQ